MGKNSLPAHENRAMRGRLGKTPPNDNKFLLRFPCKSGGFKGFPGARMVENTLGNTRALAAKGPTLNDLGNSFLEYLQVMTHSIGMGEFLQPSRGLIQIFERQFKSTVMHRDQPFCLEIMKGLNGLIRPHVDTAKGIGKIRANR